MIDDRVVVSAGGIDGRSLVAYSREDGASIWSGCENRPLAAHHTGRLRLSTPAYRNVR